MALSYFDKMVIFLLPLAVLSFFGEESVYISIEYIYSVVVITVPFLDLGLNGYFFYLYRSRENKGEVIKEVLDTFHLIYFGLFLLGGVIVLVHYYIFPFEDYILYIVFRSLFILVFSFLTAYYRIIDKPHKALFITLSSSIISLSMLAYFFFTDRKFELWVIFVGQILFAATYFLYVFKEFLFENKTKYSKVFLVIKNSLLYSWPTIIQVFVIMYIANYGKINGVENLNESDGVFLSLTQRFSMLISLTHSAILGFLSKELFVSGAEKEIKADLLRRYLFLLITAIVGVVVLIGAYYNYNEISYGILNVVFIIGFTFFWSISSYLELYYSREAKNVIKLYLAIFNGVVFILFLNLLESGYLERVTTSMFFSSLLTLLLSGVILKKRKYQLI